MSREKVLVITEEERKIIRKSYDRTDEELDEEIQHLKDWLKKQPHLPQDEDENRLRTMLYYNKFSLEKTKNKLDMYYSLKHIVPEFYSNREPLSAQISEQIDNLCLMPLPNLTPDLNRVIFSMARYEDSSKFDMMLYTKIFFGMMDLLMTHNISVADQIIIDYSTLGVGHVLKLTPVILIKFATVLKKSYSDKLKGFHLINVSPVTQSLVGLVNSVVSEKLAARVYVHKDLQSLREVISPSVLPNEYGGTAGPIDELYNNWKTYFKSQNDWLKEIGNKKSDESKRIGEPLDNDMFGMCGSFRKLNYD